MKTTPITSFKNTQGFVMLFAMLLTSIVLAITIGVANISYKEILLSSTARDSSYAFYAADTGAECALYFDYKTQPSVFSIIDGAPTGCAGVTPSMTGGGFDVFGNYREFYFNINAKYCALVRVYKDYQGDIDGDGISESLTKIDSRGYNVVCTKAVPSVFGGAGIDPHRIERLLEITYPNPVAGNEGGELGNQN